jgi:hypothetical protein
MRIVHAGELVLELEPLEDVNDIWREAAHVVDDVGLQPVGGSPVNLAKSNTDVL